MWPIVEWISTIARLSAVSTGMRHERFMLSFAIDSVIEPKTVSAAGAG
jgi:hypothetical protein